MAQIIRKGSEGEEVKKLQQLLNSEGYSLDADGIFGEKTAAAVRQYQSANGLAVDGIVGANTWGSLNGRASKAQGTYEATTAVAPQTPEVKAVQPRPEYSPSETLLSAQKAVDDWESGKPAAYEGAYNEQIEAMLQRVLNGESFNYDLNADALYKQYAEQYAREGRRAMEDTVGSAAALTGGYASSYGVTAGSEAYQTYLTKLNDIVPELQKAAYERYLNERNADSSRLALLRSLEDEDYSRYRDELSDYRADGSLLQSKAQNMSDAEWKAFLNLVEEYESDRDYSLSREQYDYKREQDEKEFLYKAEQDALAQSNWERQYALSAARSSGSSSSSSKSSKTTNSSVETTAGKLAHDELKKLYEQGALEYPDTYEEFCAVTGFSGILTPEEYTCRDAYKYKYESYAEYLEKMFKKYF